MINKRDLCGTTTQRAAEGWGPSLPMGQALAMVLTLSACGVAEPTPSTVSNFNGAESGTEDPRGDAEEPSKPLVVYDVPPRPVVRLTSEWQHYDANNLQVGIGLQWAGFGFGAEVRSQVRRATSGSVELMKHVATTDSRILKDGEGHIEVKPGESVVGRCSYVSSALFRLESGGRASLSGAAIDQSYGDVKIVDVQTTGRTFDVSDGETLREMEALCKNEFATTFKPLVERELAQAVRATFEITKFGDSRIDALNLVLQGQNASVHHRGHDFVLESVTMTAVQDHILVRGRLHRMGRVTRDPIEYTHQFSKTSGRVEDIAINPRGVDERSSAALQLSLFVARNAYNKYMADQSHKRFEVDLSLLREPTL